MTQGLPTQWVLDRMTTHQRFVQRRLDITSYPLLKWMYTCTPKNKLANNPITNQPITNNQIKSWLTHKRGHDSNFPSSNPTSSLQNTPINEPIYIPELPFHQGTQRMWVDLLPIREYQLTDFYRSSCPPTKAAPPAVPVSPVRLRLATRVERFVLWEPDYIVDKVCWWNRPALFKREIEVIAEDVDDDTRDEIWWMRWDETRMR